MAVETQQNITWTKADIALWLHMASLGRNEFSRKRPAN